MQNCVLGCQTGVFKVKEVSMPSVPEQLRQARLSKNLTIYQVAEITKIRTDHIRALEEGRYEVFPAPVYVRGFVRNYASLLKLDVPQIMVALDAELKQCPKFQEPELGPSGGTSPLRVPIFWLSKLKLTRRAVLVASLAILLGLVVGLAILRQYHARHQLTEVTPAIYEPAYAPAETLPLPQSAPRR